MEHFQRDRNKQVLISGDEYFSSINKILTLRRNYWLPPEINVKLKFLDIPATDYPVSLMESNFVKLSCNFVYDDKSDWGIVIPTTTFGEFVHNLYSLLNEISHWMEKHTVISINFFNER